MFFYIFAYDFFAREPCKLYALMTKKAKVPAGACSQLCEDRSTYPK